MTNFLKQISTDNIKSEVLMVNILLEHNLPMAVADHLSDLVKKAFPDSQLAKGFACKCTKSTQVAFELGLNSQRVISQKLQHTPFTITTDGSSDFNKLKLPIACPPRQSAVRVTKSGRKLKNLVFGRVESDIKFLGLAGMQLEKMCPNYISRIIL